MASRSPVLVIFLVTMLSALCACNGGSVITSTVVDPASPLGSSTPTNTPSQPADPNVDPSASAAATANGIQQGGKGWKGDVNVASTSAQYQGLTLDAMIATGSGLGQTLKQFPAVEAAIRQVSKATGVPDGLLAGVVYQESSFDVNATSGNPDPSPSDTEDVGLAQCPVEDFKGNAWRDPVANLTDFVNVYFLPGYKQYHSWGAALRAWNSGGGEVHLSNLGEENNNTDPNYVTEILAQHCMGLD